MLYHVKLSVDERIFETTTNSKTGKAAALTVVREQSQNGALIGGPIIVSAEKIDENKTNGKELILSVESLLDELGFEYEVDAPNFRVIGDEND